MCVFFHLIMIVFSHIMMQSCTDFRKICIVGNIFVIMTIVINMFYERKFLTISSIILMCFCLFQFGLPFLYALDPSFKSWYIGQFQESSLIFSVKLSVICIQTFATGLIMTTRKNKTIVEEKKKSLIFSDQNANTIYSLAKMLFFVTAIIAIPLALYVIYLAIINGYSYIKDDNMNIYNGFTRFAQQMIIPANLLLIIFSQSKRQEKKWTFILIFYSILLLLTGARTTSLAVFLMLLMIKQENAQKANIIKKIRNNIVLVSSVFLILFIGVFIAKYRYDGTVSSFSIVSTLESVVEEMGFNFTSLPFTKIFVPSVENYKYGLSYIYSIVCLIPRTVDFTGTIDRLHSMLPEVWLAASLQNKYGSLYSFGVGYSVIAEAFYNFGSFAFISTFVQGLIIGLFVNNYNSQTKFSKYIKYIMLFSLLTYPRRSFITLLKSVEYCVVLVGLLIYLYSSKRKVIK